MCIRDSSRSAAKAYRGKRLGIARSRGQVDASTNLSWVHKRQAMGIVLCQVCRGGPKMYTA
eukprot:3872811-Alexandrium_andersonii.AAC.1